MLVLDGNMKNARQVCSCKDIGELHYAGMEGTVVVGMSQEYTMTNVLISSKNIIKGYHAWF